MRVNVSIREGEQRIRVRMSENTGGAGDYRSLSNRPRINGVELLGDKSAAELALVPAADYAPAEKTAAMTQAVGRDASGKLWTEPGSGGGGVTREEYLSLFPVVTASGASPLTMDDGASNIPVVNCACELAPFQEGSGAPSPSNVRAIGTYSGITITHTAGDSAPTVYPLTWSDPLYGGSVDAITGVLTRDNYIIRTFTGSESWQDNSPAGVLLRRVQIAGNIDYQAAPLADYLEGLTPRGSATLTDWQCCFSTSGVSFFVKTGMTVAEWKAYLAEHPLTVLFKRTLDPTTEAITPVDMSTAYGTNQFATMPASNIRLTYRADIQLYIQRLTAPTEDDMTANTNIPSGQYFVVGNSLYRATASIAAGETITPGVNCTATNLADALNTITGE